MTSPTVHGSWTDGGEVPVSIPTSPMEVVLPP